MKRLSRSTAAGAGWLILLSAPCAAPLAAQTATPDPPDAEILIWEQAWTVRDDGIQVYHEKRHVKLNHERAYGEFSDPRITFDKDVEGIKLIVARTRLPDGATIDVPAYSRNEVSPAPAAGKPAFANLRQLVLTMSGIQPGCIVELEYTVTSQPRPGRSLARDLRLDHRYPVVSRSVTVDVGDRSLSAATFNLPASSAGDAAAAAAGGRRAWRFGPFPAAEDDAQSPPWQETSPRLTFSTWQSPDEWLRDRLHAVQAAADESPLITKLAQDWTRDATDPSEKLRAIQSKLSATFDFVDFDVSWQPAQMRRASQVLSANYGLPVEAAAVFLALARTAGVAVQPAVLVTDHVWVDPAPQDGFINAWLLVSGDGPDRQFWSAQHGRTQRSARWNGRTVLSLTDGKLSRTPLPAWTAVDESRIALRGKVTIAADGKYTAKLALRTAGLFINPESLRTRDAQQNRAAELIRRVLPDTKVTKLSVTALSDDTFDADAEIESNKPLEKLKGLFQLTLAQDPPFTADVGLPLAVSRRTQPVRITGPFDERIDLTIEWPKGWLVEAQPSSVSKVESAAGSAEQKVSIEDNSLSLARQMRITQQDIPAADFLKLRTPLNQVRSEHARTLLLKP